MANDTKTALELWERSVEQVKLATGALQSALKLMESATSKVVRDAWDTVCSARAALRAACEEEADRFAVIEQQRRQTELDLEGKDREAAAGRESGAEVEPGGVRLLPQATLPLDPSAPPTETEEAFEDPDDVVDEPEDEDEAGEGEPETEGEGDEPAVPEVEEG